MCRCLPNGCSFFVTTPITVHLPKYSLKHYFRVDKLFTYVDFTEEIVVRLRDMYVLTFARQGSICLSCRADCIVLK